MEKPKNTIFQAFFGIFKVKKEAATFVKIAVFFWRAWHDSNVRPTESEAEKPHKPENLDRVCIFQKIQ